MRKSHLRVAILAPHFAEYSVRLAEALGQQVDVLLILDKENAALECTPLMLSQMGDVRVRVFDFQPRKKLAFALGPLLFTLISFRPDILHVQEVPRYVVYGLITLMRVFSSIVLTVHDPIPHLGRDQESLGSRARLLRRIRKSADLLLAHGAYCCDLLTQLMVVEKPLVRNVQHGVMFVPNPEAKRDPVPGRILFFGRMEAYKGLDTLASAMDLLATRGSTNLVLHLAGRGPELTRLRERFRAMTNVAIQERFLTPSEVIAEFQEAAVVVVPYLEATQSGVVGAAFGNGRPVIASRVGGLVDVVRDGVNGMLIEEKNSVALAHALQTTLESRPRLGELRAGAEEAARTVMSWNRIASETIEHYEGLLENLELRTKTKQWK
jgi:glycosyltransferase involved in cell wall biosynthesis